MGVALFLESGHAFLYGVGWQERQLFSLAIVPVRFHKDCVTGTAPGGSGCFAWSTRCASGPGPDPRVSASCFRSRCACSLSFAVYIF